MITANDTILQSLKARHQDLTKNRDIIESALRDLDSMIALHPGSESRDSHRTVIDSLLIMRGELLSNREVLDQSIREVTSMASQYRSEGETAPAPTAPATAKAAPSLTAPAQVAAAPAAAKEPTIDLTSNANAGTNANGRATARA